MAPKIIAHRANLTGPDDSPTHSSENHPEQIQYILENTPYDIEIDVWYEENTNTFYLGHDAPTHPIPFSDPITFLNNDRFWIHAKNYPALSKLVFALPTHINIFSHDQDPVVLTSTRIPWVYPGQPIDQSAVIVMPERTPKAYTLEQLQQARAICTDYPHLYANLTAPQTPPQVSPSDIPDTPDEILQGL